MDDDERSGDEYGLDHEMLEAMVAVLHDAPTLTEMEVRQGDLTVRLRRPAAVPSPQTPRIAAPTTAAPLAAAQGRNGDGKATAGGAAVSRPLSAGSAPTSTQAAGPAAGAGASPDDDLVLVTAGLVGIFRALPQPIAPGYAVKAKQVIGYIEAMRLMNECIAPTAGVVADVLIHDGQPVEYGQPLFEIAPGEGAAASGVAGEAAAGEGAGR